MNVHLKVALKAGVKSGSLKQSKGTGASVSFRLNKVKKAKPAKKAAKPKAVKPKKAVSKEGKEACFLSQRSQHILSTLDI